jgi:hypothetical protein
LETFETASYNPNNNNHDPHNLVRPPIFHFQLKKTPAGAAHRSGLNFRRPTRFAGEINEKSPRFLLHLPPECNRDIIPQKT